MKLYVVEGDYDSDLEGMMFAVCTTREKADKVWKMIGNGEDVHITEIEADSIILDEKGVYM